MKARRALRIVLFTLAGLFAAAWAYGYVYIAGLACAFGNVNAQSCEMPMPWELRGDDLQVMLLLPGAFFLALLLAGWFIGRNTAR